MEKGNKSALNEKKGISSHEITNISAVEKFKEKRQSDLDALKIIDGILAKDISALSRAITFVESSSDKHTDIAKQLINACLPYANKSVRIGITGVPGVGKSTFIEAFGKHLTSLGKRVAVLAVDPSSTISRGSILGDKTRMETLVKDKNAFIRPSASGESLGGVARKTRETIILCEAAGYDTIIVETVGVGQSETTVHSMVDFFLLLKLAGAGDELQGIKRGIIEMADAIVINKADGDNEQRAQLAKIEFGKALHLYPQKKSGWQPKVTTCSALQNSHIDKVWNIVEDYLQLVKKTNYFSRKRTEQNKYWLIQTIESQLKSNFFNRNLVKKELSKQLKLVENHKTTPFAAAEYLMNL